MGRNRCGAAGLVLLLLVGGSAVAQSGAPLADAAEKKDRTKIGALLKQGVDVNASQVDGMTALHWAVYHDDLQTATLLLDAGANAKAANRYAVTPLSLACTNGNTAIAELLLKAGADPDTTLRGGETALMTAARTGKAGPVKALLARGLLGAQAELLRRQEDQPASPGLGDAHQPGFGQGNRRRRRQSESAAQA